MTVTSFSSSGMVGFWVKKTSESANASLRASLLDLERISYRMIRARMLAAEPKHQSRRELIVSHHLFEGLWHNEAPFVCPWATL